MSFINGVISFGPGKEEAFRIHIRSEMEDCGLSEYIQVRAAGLASAAMRRPPCSPALHRCPEGSGSIRSTWRPTGCWKPASCCAGRSTFTAKRPARTTRLWPSASTTKAPRSRSTIAAPFPTGDSGRRADGRRGATCGCRHSGSSRDPIELFNTLIATLQNTPSLGYMTSILQHLMLVTVHPIRRCVACAARCVSLGKAARADGNAWREMLGGFRACRWPTGWQPDLLQVCRLARAAGRPAAGRRGPRSESVCGRAPSWPPNGVCDSRFGGAHKVLWQSFCVIVA